MWEFTEFKRFSMTVYSVLDKHVTFKLCIRDIHMSHKLTAVSYARVSVIVGSAGLIPASIAEAGFPVFLSGEKVAQK
jgi:hypothetical protein